MAIFNSYVKLPEGKLYGADMEIVGNQYIKQQIVWSQ